MALLAIPAAASRRSPVAAVSATETDVVERPGVRAPSHRWASAAALACAAAAASLTSPQPGLRGAGGGLRRGQRGADRRQRRAASKTHRVVVGGRPGVAA